MTAIAMRIKGKKGLSAVQRGLAVLRKYGANAHLWLPGLGTFNGQDFGNYLDSAGMTAATADNPIGLVLDQLYGGGTLSATNLITNSGGPFTSTNGWALNNSATLSTPGGLLTVVNTAASYGGAIASIATTVGVSYTISYKAWITSGSLSWLLIGTAAGGNSVATITLPASQPGAQLTYTFVAASTTTYLTFQNNNTAGFSLAVDNISCRQVLGVSATQATTANKPTLRRGVTNLQVYSSVSSGIANSTYAGGSTGTGITPTISPNYGPDPWGGNTACRVQLSLNGGTTTTDRAYLSATAASLDNLARSAFTWAKSLAGPTTLLTRYNGNTGYYTIGSDWQLISTLGNSTTDPTHNVVEIRGGQSTTNSNTADLLVATHGVFLGSVTQQQILQCGGIPLTTSAAASSSGGNWGAWFDSTTKLLTLSSLPFSVADDHAVVCGCAPADTGVRVMFSVTPATGNARFPALYVGAGVPTVAYRDDTASGPNITVGSAPAGVPFVLSARRVGSGVTARQNGVAATANISALGTTTLTTAQIGTSANGVSAFFGSIYPTVVIKGTVPDADLLAIERMVAVFTGPTGVTF